MSAPGEIRPLPQRATNVRWRILGLMLLVSMVTYLDRLNISIAARPIMSAYHLTSTQMGRIFSAFILAYALFQVPGGWLADRFGPRKILTAAIAWWSGFTALTATAAQIFPLSLLPAAWALVVARFCLGMGEAAAWPNFNRTTANWMAPQDRAFSGSVPLAGGGLGATLTPPFIAWLMLDYGWKQSFYISAAIGVVAAALWFWYARDRPEEHPHVNAEELRLIHEAGRPEKTAGKTGVPAAPAVGAVGWKNAGPTEKGPTPWRAILTEPNVWLLAAVNLTCGYVIYIYLTWFYIYLLEARGLSLMRGSLYTTGPFLAITILAPAGGVLCDRAARRFGRNFGRRLVGMGGMLAAGTGLFLGARISNINVAIVGLSLGAGAAYFSLSSQWVVTIDITREHAGTVSGIMNWAGQMGGMISPMLMPVLAKAWGWTPALESAAGLILAGSFLWLFLKPERPLHIRYTPPNQRSSYGSEIPT